MSKAIFDMTYDELCAHAPALPGWKWVAGMRASGWILGVEPDGDHRRNLPLLRGKFLVDAVGDSGRPLVLLRRGNPSSAFATVNDAAPVLDDPGTSGHLLKLARDRAGCYLYICYDGVVWVPYLGQPDAPGIPAELGMPTEYHALVYAISDGLRFPDLED